MVNTEIRVIYADTDASGLVYHANYLRFLECGRNEFLRARGLPYGEVEARHEVHLAVVDVQVSYRKPARFDDLLTVETTLTELGRASARFSYQVRRADELLATGHTVHACVGRDGRAQRLPADLVEALRGESTRGK